MLDNPSLNQKPINIRRALISVFDKTGVVELAQSIDRAGIEILSTGGTAQELRSAGIPVLDISDYTQFPEIMDGRIKTINSLVGGGILGLRDKHENDAELNKIQWIDLVVCNLYPFSETISRENCSLALALENIDIGGPTMIRSAAKNLGWTCVVVSPLDYSIIASELRSGRISFETRKRFSAKAFGYTAQYETIIHNYLKDGPLSENYSLTFEKHSELRYGENPHQNAAAYKGPGNSEPNILNATIHQGKQLSYNNIMDADSALSCVRDFKSPACVVVKHANPCGVAVGTDLLDAYQKALRCDPVSAFGGIIAMNRTLDGEAAEAMVEIFTEVIIAPAADEAAIAAISAKKNLRLLLTGGLPDAGAGGMTLKSLAGGYLLQSRDAGRIGAGDVEVVTKRQPSAQEMADLLLAFRICKHVKSNAIIYVKDGATVGIGAGQMSRVDSARIAARKSEDAAVYSSP